MAKVCIKCQNALIHNDDAIDSSICTGKFHFYCAGYNENSFKKLSNNFKKRFVCNSCKMIGSSANTKITDKITDKNVVSEKKTKN